MSYLVGPSLEYQIAGLRAQIDKLERQAKEQQSKEARIAAMEDGTIVCFEKRFGSGSPYTYVAIKANGKWHLSNTGGAAEKEFARFITGVRRIDKLALHETLA